MPLLLAKPIANKGVFRLLLFNGYDAELDTPSRYELLDLRNCACATSSYRKLD